MCLEKMKTVVMKTFVTSQFETALATEMPWVKNNIAPEIMKELFVPKMSTTKACFCQRHMLF